MRETEITIQVFDDLDTIFDELNKLGFKLIEKYEHNDWYFSSLNTSSKVDYSFLLKNSFLVRQIITDKENVYLVYKDKEVDKQGNVLSEEKVNVKLSSLEDALKIFNKANIKCWCNIKQPSYVFKKGDVEFIVQAVQGLSNFIEYEENKSMANMNAKQKMDYMYSQIKNLNLNLGSDLSCKKVYMKYLNDISNEKTT